MQVFDRMFEAGERAGSLACFSAYSIPANQVTNDNNQAQGAQTSLQCETAKSFVDKSSFWIRTLE
jgi:hypothetical protein